MLANNNVIPHGFVVDHADGDTLNNRPWNLRLATHAQNCWNTKTISNSTGFMGVKRQTLSRNFSASILVNRVRIHLGSFKSAEEAHSAYMAAKLEFHGEFAASRKAQREL